MATYNGTAGNDTIIGGDEDDLIQGLGGLDFLQGGRGDDAVLGGDGNDTIGGNDGNDWLRGGAGNDTVTGNAGQDEFAFADYGWANADLLTDFTTDSDSIQLDVAAFGSIGATGRFAAGDARFYAVAAPYTIPSAHDADDRIIFNTSTGQLFYDVDGSGWRPEQLIATLGGGATLVASDIYVFGTPPEPVNGGSGNDTLTGADGNDTLNGLGGDD